MRIITDRAVKPVLLHSISLPFTNMDLALSRVGNWNGQRNLAIIGYARTVPYEYPNKGGFGVCVFFFFRKQC